MKTDFIEPFISATKKTFQHLFEVAVIPSSPTQLNTDNDFLDISAVIGLAGEVRGEVILSFEQTSCLDIASLFIGINSKKIDDDVIDAIGELVNIVAGNAKEGLLDYKIYISIPNIIEGKHLKLTKSCPAITIPFTYTKNNVKNKFNLIVTMQNSGAQKKKVLLE